MSSPGGGGQDLTFSVGLQGQQFQQGMTAMGQSMDSFTQTVNQNTALLVQNFAALNTAFGQFANSWQAMNSAQQGFQAQTENTRSSINNNLIGGFTGFAFSVNQVIGFLGNMKDVAAGAVDMVMKIPNAIASIPMNFLSSQLGVPTDPMQALNAGIDESWQLNVNTQKNLGAWRYIYGSGGTEKNNVVDPKVASLMNWTSTESFNLPYTRQDLIDAITQLGRMGMTSDQVQNAIPALADLGVLNPNRNLTQAAMAVQGASMGYARMLRYDYGINPADLAQYGLQISGIDHIENPDQLLPALEKYEAARGLKGSAQYAATNTWWGEWSSFQDRVQNTLLEVGGTDTSGNVRQGSLFGNMQNDLKNLTAWMDQPNNMSTILKWADAIQNSLGGGAKIAANAIKGLFDGMTQSGAGNVIFDGLQSFGDWINSPATAAALQNIGAAIGNFAGPALQTAGGALQGLIQGFQNSGALSTFKDDLKGLGDWFADPKHQDDIKHLASALSTFAGQLFNATSGLTTFVANGIQGWGYVFDTLGQGGKLQAIDQMTDPNMLLQLMNQNPYGKGVTDDQRAQIEEAAKRYFELLAQSLGETADDAARMYAAWLNGELGIQSQAPDANQANDPKWRAAHPGYFSGGYQSPADAWASYSAQQKAAFDKIYAATNPGAAIDPNTGLPEIYENQLATPTNAYRSAELAKQQKAVGKLDAAENAAAAAAQVVRPLPGLQTDTALLQTQATTDAQHYVDAFHKQFQQSNVGNTLVTSLTAQFTTGLQNNSGAFAQAMSAAMTNVAQQVVTSVLNGMATSTNAAARVPGGKTSPYAPGVS